MVCVRLDTIHNGDPFTFTFPDSFAVKVSRFLEELTLGSKIKTDAVFPFTLPEGENDIVLKSHIDPHSTYSEATPIKVRLMTLSGVQLRYTDMYVRGFNNKQYECELRAGKEHWAITASEFNIDEIKLDEIEFTKEYIKAANLKEKYEDGEVGVFYPLVNYGRFIDPKSGINIQDVRPHISNLYLLQKGFCKMGWTFKSPFYESDFGRKIISYVLDKDFGGDDNKLKLLRSNAILVQPISIATLQNSKNGVTGVAITYDKIIENYGNYFDGTYYTGAGVFDLKIGANIHVKSTTTTYYKSYVEVTAKVMMETASGLTLAIHSETQSADTYDEEFWFDINLSNIQIDNGSKIWVTFDVAYEGSNSNWSIKVIKEREGTNLTGTFFAVTPIKGFIQNNDAIDFNRLLRQDKFIDYIKGCAHLIRAKFHTDYVNQVVTMYPTYDVKVGTEEIEGFYIESQSQDITEYMIDDTEIIENPTKEKNRYLQLGYKGDGDGAIKKFYGEKKQTTYHGLKIDFGSAYTNETSEDKNPYFEATYFGDVDGLDTVAGVPICMPFMIQNYDDKKETFDINPRILVWGGNQLQRVDTGDDTYPDGYSWPTMLFLGESTNVLPLAYSDTGARLFGNGTPMPIKVGLAYGEKIEGNDLFSWFHRRDIHERFSSKRIENDFFMPLAKLYQLEFRKTLMVSVLGRTFIGKMLSVNEYDLCQNNAFGIEFIPFREGLGVCSTIVETGNRTKMVCDGNAPILEIVKNGNTYNFGIGGTSNSAIQSVDYYYRYTNDTTWTLATSLSNPTGSFQVKMIVDYADDCPTLTRLRSVDACGNSPEITQQFTYETRCLIIGLGGTNNDLDEYLVEYNYTDDGTYPNTATNDACITIPEDEGFVYVKMTVSYLNGCKAIILEETIVIPTTQSCADITADVECDEVGTPIRIGDTVHEPAMDIILYRYDMVSAWRVWDEFAIINCDFYFKRVIIYCDNVCEPYCSPVRQCLCSECTENYTATCTDLELHIVEPLTAGCLVSWSGPNGYNFVGEVAPLGPNDEDGTYTALIICGGCTYNASYEFIRANAGTAGTEEIAIND